MKCPWLIRTITQTESSRGGVQSTRNEFQEFCNCMKSDCPFYGEREVAKDGTVLQEGHCKRVYGHIDEVMA